MTAAVLLLLYGVLMTWLAPPLLSRLTRRGLNPQLGVAAWLTAILGVLGRLRISQQENTTQLVSSPSLDQGETSLPHQKEYIGAAMKRNIKRGLTTTGLPLDVRVKVVQC